MKVHPRGRSDKVADDLVVLKSGEFVQVTSKAEDGTLSGPQLLLGPLPVPEGDPWLPWGDVGVYLVAGMQDAQDISFTASDIRGKAMRCSNVVSEWLPEWFCSKRDG